LDHIVRVKKRVFPNSISGYYLRNNKAMFGNTNDNTRNGSKRLVRSGHSVSGSFGNYHLPIDHSKLTKVIILKALMYAAGATGSGYLLYFRVGGWKADGLWIIMGLFWFVQLLRACAKLYFEIKEGQIELQEKRARYNNKDFYT
jgi:hypothetical protein